MVRTGADALVFFGAALEFFAAAGFAVACAFAGLVDGSDFALVTGFFAAAFEGTLSGALAAALGDALATRVGFAALPADFAAVFAEGVPAALDALPAVSAVAVGFLGALAPALPSLTRAGFATTLDFGFALALVGAGAFFPVVEESFDALSEVFTDFFAVDGCFACALDVVATNPPLNITLTTSRVRCRNY